jgi:hypothetical protein
LDFCAVGFKYHLSRFDQRVCPTPKLWAMASDRHAYDAFTGQTVDALISRI